ncbi:hypothetical protein Cgig2_007538 [Carnegiea gigantea]|uniref:Uncharacterized protein n=1 Tax=Carnegiea gigantea TaxID=171969 RepID=A0A9Q1QCH1_9CARY|nr:hypothetical protein Cgig2_007538 [Carnegiea gigantea]
MDKIALYILENFKWDQKEVVLSPEPLPYDHKDLCPNFDLAAAEEAARDFLLPEIPQVAFCAILLNDAIKLGRERVPALFYIMVFPDFLKYRVGIRPLQGNFQGAAHPPRPLPENYHDLCLYFDLAVVEEAARDFRIPEMIQAVFYAMVVNETLELGILSRDLAKHLKVSP